MMKVRFLSLANREVDEALQWYEVREEDVSHEFLDEIGSRRSAREALSIRRHAG